VSGPFDRIVSVGMFEHVGIAFYDTYFRRCAELARRKEAVRFYDERFARMSEFYLAASVMAFRKENMMHFQIQLGKRQGVVPIRDYIPREEPRLRALERGKRPLLKMAGE